MYLERYINKSTYHNFFILSNFGGALLLKNGCNI